MCSFNLLSVFITFICIALSFQDKPILDSFPSVRNQISGGRSVLTCSVSFGQTPITFTWKKNGQKIIQDDSYQVNTDELMSTLIVKNVSARQSGNYTCLASNSKGFDSQSSYLNVKSVFCLI